MPAFLLGAGCFFCILGVAVSYPDTIWLGLACFLAAYCIYMAQTYRADRRAQDDYAQGRYRVGIDESTARDSTRPTASGVHTTDRRNRAA